MSDEIQSALILEIPTFTPAFYAMADTDGTDGDTDTTDGDTDGTDRKSVV